MSSQGYERFDQDDISQLIPPESDNDNPSPYSQQMTQIERANDNPSPYSQPMTQTESDNEYHSPYSQQMTQTERANDNPSPYSQPMTQTESDNDYSSPYSQQMTQTESDNDYPSPYSHQMTQTERANGYPSPYSHQMTQIERANDYPSPYSQPMTQTGPRYGQAYPLHTISSTVVVQPKRDPPADYLVLSVLACLFCCWPFGICAIVSSCDSRSKAKRGDIAGARASGHNALGINALNALLGSSFIIILLIIYFAY